jgi:hypothetical protein
VDYNPHKAYKTDFTAINHNFRAYKFKVNYFAQVHRLVNKKIRKNKNETKKGRYVSGWMGKKI